MLHFNLFRYSRGTLFALQPCREQNIPSLFQRKVFFTISPLRLCYPRLEKSRSIRDIFYSCSTVLQNLLEPLFFFFPLVLKIRYSDTENILLIEHGVARLFSTSYIQHPIHLVSRLVLALLKHC